jgi:hypothetical protein
MVKVNQRHENVVRKAIVFTCKKGCGSHSEMVYEREVAAVRCPQCHGPVQRKVGCSRIEGEGWFVPGYDIGLGAHIESPDHRRRVMKEKYCVEADNFEPVRKKGVIYSFWTGGQHERVKELYPPTRRLDAGRNT